MNSNYFYWKDFSDNYYSEVPNKLKNITMYF